MTALALIVLSLSPPLARVRIEATVQPVIHVAAEATPLGWVVLAERSPEADAPEVSGPVLYAQGAIVRGQLLAGGP